MSAAKLQAAFQTFHGKFLHPLLVGDKVETARPLAPGVLRHFALARPSNLEEEHAVLAALHDLASEIAPVDKLEWPTLGAMALAVACDDLAILTDEALSSRARRVIATWVEQLLAIAALPDSRSDALARHAVVSRFAQLRRDDVTVWNWAYTYRYEGRAVPTRVTAWPTIRRVRTKTQTLSFAELIDRAPTELAVQQIWRKFVSRSPITELVDRSVAPSFVFSQASIAVLADATLRSGIARKIAADPAAQIQADALGGALLALPADTPPAAVYFALALLYEIHVTALLERGAHELWKGATPDGDAFAAVLCAVTRADLPCGPGRLAPADLTVVHDAAELARARLPPNLVAVVDALTYRAGAAVPSLVGEGLA